MQAAATTNTNLITNPNFESGLNTGWALFNGATIANSAAQAYQGTKSLAVTTTAGANRGAQTSLITPLTVGVVYTVSAYLFVPVGKTITCEVDTYTAGGAFVAAHGFPTAVGNGAWQRVTVTWTQDATATQAIVFFYLNGATTFYIDAVQLEAGSVATPYFDGNSGVGYYWSGTTNLSTSFFRQFDIDTAAPIKKIRQGCQIAWSNTPNVSTAFFTINTSKIGGGDIIRGAGGAVTFFDKYQYTDESAYVMSWNITRKLPQRPYGVIMAQAEVVLNNTSKRFTPGVDGTIGSLILPNRPIKLSVGFNGESIQQFVGYTATPKSPITARTTTITAFDALTYLEGVKSAQQSFVNTSVDAIITSLLVEAGFTASQYSIEPSLQQPISYYNPNGQKMTDMFKELVEAECGLMFVDENGVITFWNRQHFNSNRTVRWIFNYSNMTDVSWDTTPIINDAQVVAKPLKVMAKTLLWTNGQPIMLLPGQSTDVIADFQDSAGSFPATSVDVPQPIATATSSEFTTNENSDGSGGSGSGVSLSSSFLFGNSYRMTFANTSGKIVYLTKLEIYGIPAKTQVLDPQEYADTTSSTNYGLNPDNNGEVVVINNNVIQDSSTALALAYILVKQYGTPMARLILPAFAVPQLQIGDCVQAVIQDGSQTKTCFVVGITTRLEGYNLIAEYDVEERPTYNYFTINTSLIGGSDSIAP